MKYESVILVKGSGKLAGNVFSHNRYGPYIRAGAVPVNPNSARQQLVRSAWQTVANAWVNILTQAQRDGWNLYGASVVMVDKLGNPIFLTGYSQFLRTNTVALGASIDLVLDAPVVFSLADSDTTMVGTVDEANQEISVAFDDTKPWLDEDGAFMQISMSRPVNPSREFIPPTLRIADFIAGDAVTPPTTPATMDCPFQVAEGQKVLVVGRIFRADGRLSNQFQYTATVTA